MLIKVTKEEFLNCLQSAKNKLGMLGEAEDFITYRHSGVVHYRESNDSECLKFRKKMSDINRRIALCESTDLEDIYISTEDADVYCYQDFDIL